MMFQSSYHQFLTNSKFQFVFYSHKGNSWLHQGKIVNAIIIFFIAPWKSFSLRRENLFPCVMGILSWAALTLATLSKKERFASWDIPRNFSIECWQHSMQYNCLNQIICVESKLIYACITYICVSWVNTTIYN